MALFGAIQKITNIALPFSRQEPTTITRTVAGVETKIFLDALTKETFGGTAEPTQHPVEGGADITDHIIIKPKTLSLSGIITETPFADPASAAIKALSASAGAAVGAALGKFGKAAGALGAVGAIAGGLVGKSIAVSVFGATDRELGLISEEFVKLRDSRETVKILTGLRLYEGYALSSFTISRDDKTGGAIKVDMEFKEILRANSRVGAIAIPKRISGLKKKNRGRQSPTELAADKALKGKSLLKNLTGLLSAK